MGTQTIYSIFNEGAQEAEKSQKKKMYRVLVDTLYNKQQFDPLSCSSTPVTKNNNNRHSDKDGSEGDFTPASPTNDIKSTLQNPTMDNRWTSGTGPGIS